MLAHLLVAASAAALLPWNAQGLARRAEKVDLTLPLPADRYCQVPGDRFSIAAVGDILLHANIQADAAKNGFDHLFDNLRPYFQAADLSYANFEGSVNPALPTSSFPEFNYKPELADAVAAAGFDVVSTANNHALDTGYDGAAGTLVALDADGVLHHGTRAPGTSSVAFLPLTTTNAEGKALKVGFLSFSFGTNEHPDPEGLVNRVWASGDKPGARKLAPELLEAVRRARASSELVVVALHWGTEYHFLPEPEQRAAAEELVTAGADLILGDHPHTLQPPAWLGPAGHESLIIFSLGNFIAAQAIFQAKSFTQSTMMLEVQVARAPGAHAQVAGFRYLPIFIENNLLPTPLVAGQHPEALQHIREQLRDPEGAAQAPLDPSILHTVGGICRR